jgi:hypothetical protein
MRHGLILLSDSTSYAQTHCIKDGGIRPLYLPVNGTAVTLANRSLSHNAQIQLVAGVDEILVASHL